MPMNREGTLRVTVSISVATLRRRREIEEMKMHFPAQRSDAREKESCNSTTLLHCTVANALLSLRRVHAAKSRNSRGESNEEFSRGSKNGNNIRDIKTKNEVRGRRRGGGIQ